MYSGRRRVLIQGAVSQLVTATHDMPLGCGHAVDLLHAFLQTVQSARRQPLDYHRLVSLRVILAWTQWVAWRRPVQRNRMITFRQSMLRVRSLGLPAHSKARMGKSFNTKRV
eukprot:5240461-Amphidinium_carterae.6